MMFKIKTIALITCSLLGATTAYAVTVSDPTERVVGFKPVYQNTDGNGSVTGELKLGATLSVDPEKLKFFDQDGDLHDVAAVQYSWTVDGKEIGNTSTISLPSDNSLAGKALELLVTPVSKTGEPLSGDPLVLTDLIKAGATGGDGSGNIAIDGNAQPFVNNLRLAGTLKQGEELSATYTFNANGGNPTDSSTYAWGKSGSTLANVGNAVITTSGQVPAYRIEPTDAGEVLELSLRAANSAAIIGNTITVDTTGKVADNGGGTGGSDIIDPNGDGNIPYIKADPVKVDIKYVSSATLAANGIDGQRPVANVDQLNVTITPAEGASPDVADYTFKWLADGAEAQPASAGANTFTPGVDLQGKAISVEVGTIE